MQSGPNLQPFKHPLRNPTWSHWPSTPLPADKSQLPKDFEASQHPELEDGSLIAWGLEESRLVDPNSRATITVLQVCGLDIKWHENVDDNELRAIISQDDFNYHKSPSESLQIFFINTFQGDSGWLPGNFTIRPSTVSCLRNGGFSGVILCSIYSAEGLWAKMGNQCFLQHDHDGNLASFELSYRYQFAYNHGMSYTQFIRTRHRHRYFCINYPDAAIQRLTAYLKQEPSLAFRPFFLDSLSADECLKGFQQDIADRRSELRKHERTNKEYDNYNKATIALHYLSRDWHTLSQDCLDFHSRLEFLHDSLKKYLKHLLDGRNDWAVERFTNTGESFEVLKSQCETFARWTSVYRDRTNIRINLLFHLANQQESRTSLQIAASTAKVAEQTQRDSSSMITIAAVTMFFLPGTFISAILSTTFFDYGPDGLSVSRKWWILPATTIPLMIATFAVWFGWQYWRFEKKRG
ncbi:uncharacterized protein BDR25DRAFT_288446 [Lindgomyces ingoldianus]|uniref:Uncharacterized protein n=1 Tax=Lindgomyces ingoldianus TaxID=673940 RepID=A0ACB6QTB4_9PLEO|nr:uncharacterized protein BDR25DRAFT_288446 [Lindgomyces ingoldianus]KAF2469542.1 hypothetical protein BDR25DRAFT_288446 [Lindgomyces ingoldianus]